MSVAPEKETKSRAELPEDIAAAIAAGILLHRSGPGGRVVLYEKGRQDEGWWGRSARAGAAASTPHRTRRDT